MRRIAIDAIVTVVAFLLDLVSAGAQQNAQLSENVFEFMDTMGCLPPPSAMTVQVVCNHLLAMSTPKAVLEPCSDTESTRNKVCVFRSACLQRNHLREPSGAQLIT